MRGNVVVGAGRPSRVRMGDLLARARLQAPDCADGPRDGPVFRGRAGWRPAAGAALTLAGSSPPVTPQDNGFALAVSA